MCCTELWKVSHEQILEVWTFTSVFQLSACFWWQWTLRLQWLLKTSPSCACAFFKSWSNHLLQPARKTRYHLRCWAKHLEMIWLKSGTPISVMNSFVRNLGVAFLVTGKRTGCGFLKNYRSFFVYKDVPVDALTTVKPYSNEIHAQAQLWLKRDPKASYEAWKKCLPARGSSVFLTLCNFVKEMYVLPSLIRNIVL